MTLPAIRWYQHAATQRLPPFDGSIGRILFRAHSTLGVGWHVDLNAC